MTVAELQDFAPNTNWTRLLIGFTNLPIKPDTIVNVKELEFVKNVDSLLTRVDKSVLANYLIWRVVFSSMPQLSSDWREIYEKLNRIVSGRKSEKQVNLTLNLTFPQLIKFRFSSYTPQQVIINVFVSLAMVNLYAKIIWFI